MARSRVLISVAAAAMVAGATPSARAEESSQGPAYVQGSLGVHYWDFPSITVFGIFTTSASWTGFRPELEAGYHISGRHDGFVFGVRQAFYVTGARGEAAGATSLRLGYDLPFKAGQFEINVDPFATVGVGYFFDGPHAGITATGGAEIKLFIASGLYVMAKPAELGFQCFHEAGVCGFIYAAGAGAGFAFGGR